MQKKKKKKKTLVMKYFLVINNSILYVGHSFVPGEIAGCWLVFLLKRCRLQMFPCEF